MKRISKVLSIFTIVMLALALMPAGSVLAALNPAGPITSGVAVAPIPVVFNSPATVTASVDNTANASNIVSAEYSLNGGPWKEMSAADGAFDALTEGVTATFTPALSGPNQVCVHANDALGNNGPDACLSFTVADTMPPVVSNVKFSAVLTSMTGIATLTATVDDSTTGGSNIASAAYTLNGGAPVAMTAVDGPFGTVVKEAVTATINPISAGANTVCVTGTDVPGNTSKPVCSTFTLYGFKGFLSPIKMGVTNSANAPQTIPIKWWLTDAAGKPVSKASVFSTIKVMSYQVDCKTLTGDATKASAIGSPGKTGLKYLGNGRWQINWKTDKSFRGTCRKMFVQFTSVQSSPEVVFAFKK
jgi:hypothetical protein